MGVDHDPGAVAQVEPQHPVADRDLDVIGVDVEERVLELVELVARRAVEARLVHGRLIPCPAGFGRGLALLGVVAGALLVGLDVAVVAEHFWAANFKARDLAIEAYESSAPDIRAEFDQMAETMTSILREVSSAMREAVQDTTKAKLAEQAIGWLKPLVAAAGGVINGGSEADVETIMAA